MNARNPSVAAVALCCLSVPFVAADAAAAEEERDDEHHILEEIIVAATPLERTVEQLAQPTSVLAGDALVRKQAASIGETLADEPGVNSTYFGPVASRPVIRGQYGERVRVLSNGLDSLDASALSEDHAVSVDSILAERVEVVRGPATLLYGSGAAGGIVNVVDRRLPEDPPDGGFEGIAGLDVDSATGSRSGALSLGFGTVDIAGHVDWSRRDTDDVDIPGYAESDLLRSLEAAEGEEHDGHDENRGSVENSWSETETGAASLLLGTGSGSIGLAVSRYTSLYGVPGHAHAEEDAAAGEAEPAISIDLDQTRYDLHAVYDWEAFIEQATLRVARNEYRHVELEGAEAGTRYDTRGTDARLELKHRSIGRLEGAIGIQFKEIDLAAEGEEAFVPGSDTRQLSVFAFEEFPVSDALVLQGSARIERQKIESGSGATFEDTAAGASIGAILSLPRELTLAVNASHTERQPNATELYADGPHVAVQRYERGAVALGSDELNREVSTNFDVTLRGASGRYEWTVTGFVNDVDDYVLLAPTAQELDGLPVFDYGQGDVRLYGAEAQLLVDLFEARTGHVHARLFGDFVHGENRDTGDYLPRLPPLRLGLGLHYTRERLEAAIETTWNREQDKTAPNELPTDSFTMVDAELSYLFPGSGLFVFLRGTNLGDAEARRHSSPLKDLVPLPGRSAHLGLRFDF